MATSKDSLKPYKFAVTAIVQQVDSEGNIVGEVQSEPVVLFGCDMLEQWARSFPTKLAETQKSQGKLAQ